MWLLISGSGNHWGQIEGCVWWRVVVESDDIQVMFVV